MEILIGVACGLFMGTVFINVAAVMVFLVKGSPSVTAALLAKRSYPISLAALVPLVVTLGWSIAGGILGVAFLGAEELFPESGLGSPNQVYTIAILAFTFNAIILGILWVKRLDWWEGYILGLAFVGIFGWLMPWLAS